MHQVAIVTGAASGIGRALATALVQDGGRVTLADVNEAAVHRVAAELGKAASAAVLDVRNAASVSALVQRVAEQEGRIDLMVNNAGIGSGGEVDELSVDHYTRVIDVNVLGVVHGTAATYRLMVSQGRGHIVNIASLAGLIPSPLLAPYALSKHAVVGFSLSLRAEAAARGVRVSVVCPGVIETPLLDGRSPADLPPPPHQYDARAMLVHAAGKPYDAGDLAADVLRGIARNKAVIVSPRRARLVWWLQRLVPGLVERENIRTAAWARQHALLAETLHSSVTLTDAPRPLPASTNR